MMSRHQAIGMFAFVLATTLLAYHTVSCEVDTCANDSCTSDSVPGLPNMERTFIAIKPDGVQRGLVGKIIQRFEDRGYKLVALKQMTASKEHLETHYEEHRGRPFFAPLVEYMSSGPVVAMVWQGRDVVKQGRQMIGATDPLAAAAGTIRADFAIVKERNVCHGSDSVASARREIALWFAADEISDYDAPNDAWVYE